MSRGAARIPASAVPRSMGEIGRTGTLVLRDGRGRRGALRRVKAELADRLGGSRATIDC